VPDVQAAQALVSRLRQKRKRARADALRYNQERNSVLTEIIELRAQHSAAVGTALATVFLPLAKKL
jgi:hypothetical protein